MADGRWLTADGWQMFFYLIPLAVVLVDQLTKEAIIRAFRLGEGFPIIPGYLDITFVLNPGASFSLLATLPESIRVPFFIVVSSVAVVLIVVYRTRYLRADRFGSICLALILGGAIGNLIDRIRYGVVVDFIDAHLHQYHWPVFNVADSAISVGVTLLILQMIAEWWKERKDGH